VIHDQLIMNMHGESNRECVKAHRHDVLVQLWLGEWCPSDINCSEEVERWEWFAGENSDESGWREIASGPRRIL